MRTRTSPVSGSNHPLCRESKNLVTCSLSLDEAWKPTSSRSCCRTPSLVLEESHTTWSGRMLLETRGLTLRCRPHQGLRMLFQIGNLTAVVHLTTWYFIKCHTQNSSGHDQLLPWPSGSGPKFYSINSENLCGLKGCGDLRHVPLCKIALGLSVSWKKVVQAQSLFQLHSVRFSVWIFHCHDERFNERSRLCGSCEQEHESYGWMNMDELRSLLVQSLTASKGLLFRS